MKEMYLEPLFNQWVELTKKYTPIAQDDEDALAFNQKVLDNVDLSVEDALELDNAEWHAYANNMIWYCDFLSDQIWFGNLNGTLVYTVAREV